MKRLNNKGFGAIEVVLAVVIVTVLGFVGYKAYTVYTANSENDGQLNEKAEKKDNLQNELNESTAEPKVAEKEEPLVAFEPNGLFSSSEKKELYKKLINPLIDFNEDKVKVIIIEVNSPQQFVNGDSDDKYLVNAYITSTNSQGFLYGSKKKGLDWWQPSCLEGCKFTDSFKQKYPEIVTRSN